MNDILVIISFSLLCVCLITLLIYWKLTSIKRSEYTTCCKRMTEAAKNIDTLDNLINTSVGAINQKMVSHLKKDQNFKQSDKEEAFNECRKMVYSMASVKNLQELSYLDIDVDSWIDTRIEYFVRQHKNSRKQGKPFILEQNS